MGVKIGGNSGNINLVKPLLKGDKGGYYIPDVNEEGFLSWTPSEEEMPQIEGANIKGVQGEKGESGVYVSDVAPESDEVLVWLRPDEEVEEVATIGYVDAAIANIDIPEVDFTGYATEDYVTDAIGAIDVPVYSINNAKVPSGLSITAEDKALIEKIIDKVKNKDFRFFVKYSGRDVVEIIKYSSTQYHFYMAGDRLYPVYTYKFNIDANGNLTNTTYPSKGMTPFDMTNTLIPKAISLTGANSSIQEEFAYIVDNYALKSEIPEEVDLTGYAKTEDIPDVSQYQTAEEVETAITNALSAIGVAEEGVY